MTELINEKCEACRADSPRVTDDEIAQLQPVVSEWAIVEENEIPRLQRVFRYPNFVSSLAFTDAVGALAEEQGHHPRIVTEWGRVTVTWWTHKIRNLHRNALRRHGRQNRPAISATVLTVVSNTSAETLTPIPLEGRRLEMGVTAPHRKVLGLAPEDSAFRQCDGSGIAGFRATPA